MKKNCYLILLFIFIAKSNTQAASYDVFSGGFSSCKKLTWNTTDGKSSTEASTAIKQWNNVSSKVKISKTSSSKANIMVSVGKVKAPKAGDLGLTWLYKLDKSVSNKSTWTKAVCIRYISSNNKTSRYATTTHEIGHALSMAHCSNAGVHSAHIMHQGIKSSYKLSKYDKDKLKYKWGK